MVTMVNLSLRGAGVVLGDVGLGRKAIRDGSRGRQEVLDLFVWGGAILIL
jgi:hypothetical protein